MVPTVMYFSGVDTPGILISTAWFLGQYLVTAFAARTTGIRFVQTCWPCMPAGKWRVRGKRRLVDRSWHSHARKVLQIAVP